MTASGKVPTDHARERRIAKEVVVDAYTENERIMGWYYHLEGALRFPFRARCIRRRVISPLRPGDEVDVVGMAPEEECEHEMFVLIPWERRRLAVPLAQLEGVKVDRKTARAIGDWHYLDKEGVRLKCPCSVGVRRQTADRPTRSATIQVLNNDLPIPGDFIQLGPSVEHPQKPAGRLTF